MNWDGMASPWLCVVYSQPHQLVALLSCPIEVNIYLLKIVNQLYLAKNTIRLKMGLVMKLRRTALTVLPLQAHLVLEESPPSAIRVSGVS